MTLALLLLASTEPAWAAAASQIALLLVLIAMSGGFSGSESVLFSLTPAQLAQDGPHVALRAWRRQARRLMQHPRHTLMTILLGNTAVNVLLFASSFLLFESLAQQFGGWITPVSAVVSVLLVVILGEVLPKVVGVSFAETLLPYAAAYIGTTGYVLSPVARLLTTVVVAPLERMFFGRDSAEHATGHNLTPEELKALLETSRRRGVIGLTEDNFLREVIDLSHLRVRDVMTPRVEVVAYDVAAPADGLRELMRTTRRKKVPVYERTIDQIVGLIYAKVLFLNPTRKLRELVLPVRFIPDTATCEQLLQHFRNTKSQIAIVVDEFGGMAGVATLEDVLEQIVGDIQPPEEQALQPEILQLGPNEFDVSGRLSVHYWSATFGLPRLTERVATVGGLATARLGRPARVNDVVRIGNVELRVTHVVRKRVERVRLRVLADEPQPEGDTA